MAELNISGKSASSVFDLLGTDENDITYSVAWALSRCPAFLQKFLEEVIQWTGDISNAVVRLQTYEKNGTQIGITDMEIEIADQFHLIIEAKKGWILPTTEQILKYTQRPSYVSSTAPVKKIVVCSECSKEYADVNLMRRLPGVSHLSWGAISELARRSLVASSNAEKHLLRELITYLGGFRMQNIDSNRVYVVSLAQGAPVG
jgi:hypothetical protein